jgi:hypothetical protein
MQPPPLGGRLAPCTACVGSAPFVTQPLFILTGASGAGKTTVTPLLGRLLGDCAVFDKDLLWGRTREDQFDDCWLLIAHSQAQQNRPTVICGTTLPWDLEKNPERAMVGTIYFANLHCTDEIREQRLRARPAWRQSSSDEVIAHHNGFAAWLLEHASTEFDPPMPTFDTSCVPTDVVAAHIAAWVKKTLAERLQTGLEPEPVGSTGKRQSPTAPAAARGRWMVRPVLGEL